MRTRTHEMRNGTWITPRTSGLLCCCLVLGLAAAAGQAAARAVSDQAISDAVEDAFFFDQAVPFDRIDVATRDGVVTLTGNVSNLLAKERAAHLAQTIKGVRSVVNRIDVRPNVDRSAAELRDEVTTALLADPATDSYEISVDARNGGHVTLSGVVASWAERRLAEKVAKGVRGVTDVTNDITVDYQTERTDFEIKPEVEAALEWSALVNDLLIDVSVGDGTVTLTGTVDSAAEKRKARELAWVAGVKGVDVSELTVRDWTGQEMRRKREFVARSPDEIKDAVNEALLQDPRTAVFKITPEVDGSVVTLRGTVDNLKARRAAVSDARNTVGVSRVVNRLKVRPPEPLADAQIEERVRQALSRDPYVDRYEISVNVVDGTVYLSGTVDSYFEKAQADDAASRVAGVADVSNGLIVTATTTPMVYDPYVYDWYAYDYDWYDVAPTHARKPDSQIREEIESELWWSPFVDSDQVTVSVDDGVATLTGTVDTWSERRAATENALEGGAWKVENKLNLRTE